MIGFPEYILNATRLDDRYKQVNEFSLIYFGQLTPRVTFRIVRSQSVNAISDMLKNFNGFILYAFSRSLRHKCRMATCNEAA
jgi:hypothetical protein